MKSENEDKKKAKPLSAKQKRERKLSDIAKELKQHRGTFTDDKGKTDIQASLFDMVDRFSAVKDEIQTSDVVDFSVKGALNTVGEVATALENPNLSKQDRLEVLDNLKAAEKQLSLGSDAGLEGDKKDEYKKVVKQVQDEIDTFRKLSEGGIRSFDATRSFVEQQKDDAQAMLVGALTQNPALALGFKLFKDFKSARKESKEKAENKVRGTRRDRIKELETQQTKLQKVDEKGKEKEKKEKVEKTSKSDILGGEISGLYDAVKSGIIDGLAGAVIGEGNADVITGDMTSTIVQASEQVEADIANDPELKAELMALPEDQQDDAFKQLLVDKITELTVLSQSTLDVMMDVKNEAEDQTAIAEKANIYAKENELEKKRSLVQQGKDFVGDKVEQAKKGLMDTVTGMVGMFTIMKAKIIPMIISGLTAVGSALMAGMAFILPLLPIIIGAGVLLYAGFKAVKAFMDEGGDIFDKVGAGLRAFGDTILGIFGTDGGSIATAILDVFDELAQWWEDFSLVDTIKEMFGFGNTEEEKRDNITAEEATQGSEAAKEAFSTGTMGFGNDIHIDDEEQLKLVDSPSLRAVYKSTEATDDTKEAIIKELDRREEPLVKGAGKPEAATSIDAGTTSTPAMESGTTTSPKVEVNVDGDASVMQEIERVNTERQLIDKETATGVNSSVVMNQQTTNQMNLPSQVPITTPGGDTARLQSNQF